VSAKLKPEYYKLETQLTTWKYRSYIRQTYIDSHNNLKRIQQTEIFNPNIYFVKKELLTKKTTMV